MFQLLPSKGIKENAFSSIIDRIGILSVAAAFLILHPTTGSAKYVATGPIKGNVCSNYLFFEACHEVEIKAVRSTDGKLYTVGTEIEDVDEFREDSSLCFVRVKHNNWYDSMKSWVSWAGYELGYNWWELFLTADNNGDYVRVDPEYLVFKCTKQE